MPSTDTGKQRIGWKFSTPLQADYLNTFMAGLSNQGLLTRPLMRPEVTSSGAEVTIYPFSMLIVPTDIESSYTDENGEKYTHKIVKITTEAIVTLNVTTSDIAIGFTYSFANKGTTQPQWFGEFVTLDGAAIAEFKGIIIATVQTYLGYDGSGKPTRAFSVRTSGADISDALLIKEGWNPNCWLSLVSPRRMTGHYNTLEVRSHNDLYSGYISGNSGCKKLENLKYMLELDAERGFMPGNYNAFSLQSSGFYLANYADELPLIKVHGGIFAMVDASKVNNPPQGEGSLQFSFANRLVITPVKQEDINIYYDNYTLVIN